MDSFERHELEDKVNALSERVAHLEDLVVKHVDSIDKIWQHIHSIPKLRKEMEDLRKYLSSPQRRLIKDNLSNKEEKLKDIYSNKGRGGEDI